MTEPSPMARIQAEIAKRMANAEMLNDDAEMTLMGWRLKSKNGCTTCGCGPSELHNLECTYAKSEIERVQKAHAGE